MKKRLTKVFPPHIKPVHIGPYQTRFMLLDGHINPVWGYSRWDGEGWTTEWRDLETLEEHRPLHHGEQKKWWRGLTEQSK